MPLAHPARLVPIAAACLLVAAVVGAPFGSSPSVRGGSGPTYGARMIVRGLVDRGAADGAAGRVVPPASSLAVPAAPTAAPDSGGFAPGVVTPGVVTPGVLATPIAGPTSAPPVRLYTVVAGDTLTAIASRFGVSAATIYWANAAELADPAALRLNQQLVIPVANGLVIVAQSSDSLETLALRYSVTVEAIAEANGLTGSALTIGQLLVIPGVSLGPVPTPTPPPATPKPTARPAAPKRAVGSTSGGSGYVGGRLGWPVAGGKISQRFSSYHPALDIAAPYGTSVLAAAAGTVVYAGWRSYSGGGNVIWISPGNGLYTTYNHLSGWSVRVGQAVGRGQRIGAVGTSGVATGPHLHFEVWTRYPWAGGSSAGLVNPCRYLGC